MYTPFYTLHPAFTVIVIIVVAVLLFFFGLFGLFGSKEYITLEDLSGALRFNYSKENRSMVTEEMVMEMVDELNAESITKVLSRMVIRTDTSSKSVASRIPDSPSLTSTRSKTPRAGMKEALCCASSGS